MNKEKQKTKEIKKLIEELRKSENDKKAGRVIEHKEAMKKLREKHL